MDLNRKNITSFWTDARWSRQVIVDKNFEVPVVKYEREIQPSPEIEGAFEQQDNIFNGDNTIFFFTIPLLLLSARFIFKIGFRKTEKERLNFLKHDPKIACRQCQFFSKNPYLKCTVHPDTVLTKEARNCRDYQEKSN
ncbi:hypothetical protein [Myxosarcina sp. GI1(2024)]